GEGCGGGRGRARGGGVGGGGGDWVAEASRGTPRGAGPASVVLPLPVRPENPSQTVVLSFADKTEPMAFNYYATGAYLLPRFNTGLVIAASKMKRGYIMDVVDLDTKAQAVEAGGHPRDPKAPARQKEGRGQGPPGKGTRPRAA